MPELLAVEECFLQQQKEELQQKQHLWLCLLAMMTMAGVVLMLPLAVLVVFLLPLMMAAVLLVTCFQGTFLQAVLEYCDESSYWYTDIGGALSQGLLLDSHCVSYCGVESSSTRQTECSQSVGKVHRLELELISNLPNMIPRRIKVCVTSSAGAIALILVTLVLHLLKFNWHEAASNNYHNNGSLVGAETKYAPLLYLMWPQIHSPVELTSSLPGSMVYRREFMVPKKQIKYSQTLHLKVKSIVKSVTFKSVKHIKTRSTFKSTNFKFMLHINGKLPGFAQFVGDTVRSKFFILCYKFFSVAYANAIPMISSSAKVLKRHGRSMEAETIVVKLYGGPNHGYCAMLAIGVLEQVQEFCVLIDTGSSNLAIAASAHPDIEEYFDINSVGSSFENLGTEVSISYTGGQWSGTLARDIVSIDASQQAAHSTSHSAKAYITLIKSSDDFFINDAAWEGILGLAYPSLAKPDSKVEPYWDTLRKAEGMRDVFAIQFCPPLDSSNSSSGHDQGGRLILGGEGSADALFTGSIFYTPIIEKDFYKVLISSMRVGGIQVDIPCTKFNCGGTIVDSGTTDIYLPTDSFKAVRDTFLEFFENSTNLKIPVSFWSGDSKLAWSSSNLHFIFSNFPTVYIGFASHQSNKEEFALAVTPQIYLRQVEGSAEEQTKAECHPKCDFFVFGIKQRRDGAVIGGNIMLGFTTIFDRDQDRIGFAKSTCQYQDHDQDTIPHIVGHYQRDPANCICPSMPSAATIAAVVIVAFSFLLVIISALLTIKLYRFKSKNHQSSNSDKCSCLCFRRKAHSVEEDRETTELTAHRDSNDEGTGGSHGPPSQRGLTAVRSILIQAGANVLNRLKSIIHVKYERVGYESENDNNVLTNRNEDLIVSEEGEALGPHQESDSISRNSSTQNESSISDELVVESISSTASQHQEVDTLSCHSGGTQSLRSDTLVAGEISSTASFHQAQHDQLVTGKSSYIGENYPKLELSDSPQSSLTSSLNMSAINRQASSDDTDMDSNDLNPECDPALSSITICESTVSNSLQASPCGPASSSTVLAVSSSVVSPCSVKDKPASSGESDYDQDPLLVSESDCNIQQSSDDQDSAKPSNPNNEKADSPQSTKQGKKTKKKRRNKRTESKTNGSSNKTSSTTLEPDASIMEKCAVVSNNGTIIERSPASQQQIYQINQLNNRTSQNNADEDYNSKILAYNIDF